MKEFEINLSSGAQDSAALTELVNKLVEPYAKYEGIMCFSSEIYRSEDDKEE